MTGKSPFDPELINLPIPQLDWILAMYAKDRPDEIKLIRRGPDGKIVESLPPGRQWISNKKAWDAVLRGNALDDHHYKTKIAPIREAIERMRAEGKLGPAGAKGLAPAVQQFTPNPSMPTARRRPPASRR